MTTATFLPDYPADGLDEAQPREITVSHAPVDQAFRQITRLSGSFVLLVMTATFQQSSSWWGRNNPLPGLTKNLPTVTRIPESGRRPSVLVDVSYVLTVLAIVLFTLLLNLTVVSQIQHFSAQHRLYHQLRQSLAEGSTPIGQLNSKGRPVKPGTPIALLKIPELGVSEVVVEGTASRQTKLGVGHRPDTPYPGQGAIPSVLMGRAAAYGGVFRHLDRLNAGQEFTVRTGQGLFTYRVIGPRTGGKVPALTATTGRLTLMTAKGAPFMNSSCLPGCAHWNARNDSTPASCFHRSPGILRSNEPLPCTTSSWLIGSTYCSENA